MAAIAAPSAANNYSIDVTEVTKGQYDLWVGTNPPLPKASDLNCGYVTTYAEQASGGALYAGADAAHHPVANVDWCDAFSYCQAVGKRLCGAIGGGAVDPSVGYKDATQSQWFRACSSGATQTYPYGSTYQPTHCDGLDYWSGNTSTMQTVAVGSLTNCVTSATGFAGVYDLSGNVWEWEDSCNGPCLMRGNAFNGSSQLTCGYVVNSERYHVANSLGFRCCSQ